MVLNLVYICIKINFEGGRLENSYTGTASYYSKG